MPVLYSDVHLPFRSRKNGKIGSRVLDLEDPAWCTDSQVFYGLPKTPILQLESSSMPIQIRCPHCQKAYKFGDHLRGKTLRCKQCTQSFAVEANPKRPAEDPDDAGTKKPSGVRPKRAPEQESSPSRPLPARRQRDEDDAPNRRPRKRRKSGFPLTLYLILGGVGLVLLAGGVVAAVLLFNRSPSGPGGEQAGGGSLPGGGGLPGPVVNLLGPWPEPTPFRGGFGPPGPLPAANETVTLHVAGMVNEYTRDDVMAEAGKLVDPRKGSRGTSRAQGDRTTMLVWPVSDPSAYAKKITFGEVKSVVGRVITLVAHKIDGPPADADPVTKALYDLAWKHDDRRGKGLQELRNLKPNERRAEVATALEAFLASDKDQGRRAQTVEVLAIWGTLDNLPTLIRATKDMDAGVRHNAIRALGRFQDETALKALGECLATDGFVTKDVLKAAGPAAEKVLLECMESPTDRVRQDACELLELAGSNACVPAMIRALKESVLRRAALKTLMRLKVTEAAEPIAQILEDSSCQREVIETLKGFGPAAEKAVIGQLSHKDAVVRYEACRILKEIGTRNSLQALATLAQQDAGSRGTALEAIQAIQARR
jgi:HEAT repeat protein